MARTNKKVGYSPTGKLADVTPDMAAAGIETAFRMLEGRWKMVIIFHLFDRSTLRFSELERTIPGVSQKMLIQQLRELERDGIVTRKIYPQVPPKVEYSLTKWGKAMCPALNSVLEWAAEQRSKWFGEFRRVPHCSLGNGHPCAACRSQLLTQLRRACSKECCCASPSGANKCGRELRGRHLAALAFGQAIDDRCRRQPAGRGGASPQPP